MCHRSVAVCLEVVNVKTVGCRHTPWLHMQRHSRAGSLAHLRGACSSPCPPRTCADLAVRQQRANCAGVAPLSAAGRLGHHRQLHLLWGQRGGGSGQARLLPSPVARRGSTDHSSSSRYAEGEQLGAAPAAACAADAPWHTTPGAWLRSHSSTTTPSHHQVVGRPRVLLIGAAPAQHIQRRGLGGVRRLSCTNQCSNRINQQSRRAVPSSSQHARSAGQQRGDGIQPLPLTASQVDHREALRQRGVQQQEGQVVGRGDLVLPTLNVAAPQAGRWGEDR